MEGPLNNLTECMLQFPKLQFPYTFKPGNHYLAQLAASTATGGGGDAASGGHSQTNPSSICRMAEYLAQNGRMQGGNQAFNNDGFAAVAAMVAAAAYQGGSAAGTAGSAGAAAINQPGASHAAAYALAAAAAAAHHSGQNNFDQPASGLHRLTSQSFFDHVGYIGNNRQFANASANSSKQFVNWVCITNTGGREIKWVARQ